MARNFVAASQQFLERNAVVNAACSFSVVFKPTTLVDQALVGEYSTGATGAYRGIFANATGAFQAQSYDGVSTVNTSARPGGSVGTTNIHRGCAVFANNASVIAYLDGVAAAEGTTSVTVPSLSYLNIGRLYRATPTWYANSMIAEVGVWNVGLTPGEALAVTKGFDPRLIRPQSLVAYYSITGNESPELDRWKNRYDLTVYNAPAKADHPPMIYAY